MLQCKKSCFEEFNELWTANICQWVYARHNLQGKLSCQLSAEHIFIVSQVKHRQLYNSLNNIFIIHNLTSLFFNGESKKNSQFFDNENVEKTLKNFTIFYNIFYSTVVPPEKIV